MLKLSRVYEKVEVGDRNMHHIPLRNTIEANVKVRAPQALMFSETRPLRNSPRRMIAPTPPATTTTMITGRKDRTVSNGLTIFPVQDQAGSDMLTFREASILIHRWISMR